MIEDLLEIEVAARLLEVPPLLIVSYARVTGMLHPTLVQLMHTTRS